MSVEFEKNLAADESSRGQLRQLEHDLKTHLGVISMGLHALDGAREEPVEFEMLRKAIDQEGVKPLKEIISRLIDLACRDQNEPSTAD